jgi:hypothetical protein
MIVAKQVANSITGARALIAACLVWLGIALEAAGLQLAAWLMIADWAGDMLDGRIARRSRVQYRTWKCSVRLVRIDVCGCNSPTNIYHKYPD